MDKISDWKNVQIKDNLLARLLNLFYVVPPVVTKTSLMRQRSLIMRLNLPVNRGQRISDRARENSVTNENADCAAMSVPLGEDLSSDEVAGTEEVELDPESDPARSCKLGTGPGQNNLAQLPCRFSVGSCCCCCPKRRKSFEKCSIPHIYCSSMSMKTLVEHRHLRLRDPSSVGKPFVLGVLSCGYVLSGSGKLKELSRKRA